MTEVHWGILALVAVLTWLACESGPFLADAMWSDDDE